MHRRIAAGFVCVAWAAWGGWAIGGVGQLAHAQGGSVGAAESEACTLLLKDDASAALGSSVGSPKASSGRSMMPGTTASSCEYAGAGLSRVHLDLWRATSNVDQFRQTYQIACSKKSKDGLAGLGDLACWYDSKHEELQVLKGPTFISIELRGKGNPTEAIKAVAQKALSRVR